MFSLLHRELKATVDTLLQKTFFLLAHILTFSLGSLGTEPGRR